MKQKHSIQIRNFNLPLINDKSSINSLNDGTKTNRTQATSTKGKKQQISQQKKNKNKQKIPKQSLKKNFQKQNDKSFSKKKSSFLLPKIQRKNSRFATEFQKKQKKQSILQKHQSQNNFKRQLENVQSEQLFNPKYYKKRNRQSSNDMFDKIHNTLLASKFHGSKIGKQNKINEQILQEKIKIIKKNMQKMNEIQSMKKIEKQTLQNILTDTKTEWKKVKVQKGKVLVNKSCVIEQIQKINKLQLKNDQYLKQLLQNKKVLVDIQLNHSKIIKKIL